jgi:UDP-2,4-diacetamido-2,4,6-trideoxy-beta-L-altropyranose hydrolase
MSDLRLPKPLLIRADAGGKLGIGHVMRMWALAQAYRDRGGAVHLVAATCPQPLMDRIEADGVTVRCMSDLPPGSSEDAGQTAATALNLGAAWAVVDGYHFGTDYQRVLRSRGLQVLAVDDYGHCETWSADAVLNQNIYAPERTLKSEVPDCRFLKGLRYALLRREFRQTLVPPETPAIGTSVGGDVRLLVTLGGVDADNATGHLLRLLKELETPHRQVRVVVGPGNPHVELLEAAATQSPHGIELLHDVRDMIPHYLWATHIISAGGSTCWEWLCLGKRALVLPLADNQKPIVESLTQHGLAGRLPWGGGTFMPDAISVLKGYLKACQTASLTGSHGLPAQRWVDGNGADRVAAFLDESGAWIRPAFADDAREWFELANDPMVRRNSFHGDPIPWETHMAWFRRQLCSAASLLWSALDGEDRMIGFARFHKLEDGGWELGVAVKPTHRGRGWGLQIMRLSMARFRELKSGVPSTLVARIKPANMASLKLFRALGFIPDDARSAAGGEVLTFKTS